MIAKQSRFIACFAIVVAIALLAFATFIAVSWPYWVEQRVVAKIEAAGGEVVYSYWRPDDVRRYIAKARIFERVDQVYMYNGQAGDDIVSELRKLRYLGTVGFDETAITDKALIYIREMPSVFAVHLYGTSVTDAAIPDIIAIPNLQHIVIAETKITPHGYETLKRALPDHVVVSY